MRLILSVEEIFFFFLMFIYFWEKEREEEGEREWAGERQRERKKESKAGSMHWAVKPRARHRAWIHEPWDHDLSQSQTLKRLSHPTAPLFFFFFFLMFIYFLREGKSMSWGWAERGRHRTWSRVQDLSYQHRALHGAQTHKPWDHDLSWSQMLNRLSHPGIPVERIFKTGLHLFCILIW